MASYNQSRDTKRRDYFYFAARARRRKHLEEMVRASEEGGFYDKPLVTPDDPIAKRARKQQAEWEALLDAEQEQA